MGKRIKAGNYAVLVNGIVDRTFWEKGQAEAYAWKKKGGLFGNDDCEILSMNSGVIWRI